MPACPQPFCEGASPLLCSFCSAPSVAPQYCLRDVNRIPRPRPRGRGLGEGAQRLAEPVSPSPQSSPPGWWRGGLLQSCPCPAVYRFAPGRKCFRDSCKQPTPISLDLQCFKDILGMLRHFLVRSAFSLPTNQAIDTPNSGRVPIKSRDGIAVSVNHTVTTQVQSSKVRG